MSNEQHGSLAELGATWRALERLALTEEATVDYAVAGAVIALVDRGIGLTTEFTPVNTSRHARASRSTAPTVRRAWTKAEKWGLIERESGREGPHRRGYVRLSDRLVDAIQEELEAEDGDK